MKAALKKVEGTYKCKRCVNGVVNREAETGLNGVIGSVESFVYLRDRFNLGGGCLSVVMARVRVRWMKIQGIEWGIVWKQMVSEDEREGV